MKEILHTANMILLTSFSSFSRLFCYFIPMQRYQILLYNRNISSNLIISTFLVCSLVGLRHFSDVKFLGIIFFTFYMSMQKYRLLLTRKKVYIRRFESCPIWLDGVAKLVRQNSYESISDTQNILDMSYGAVGEWFMPAVLKTAEA